MKKKIEKIEYTRDWYTSDLESDIHTIVDKINQIIDYIQEKEEK